MNFLAMNIRRRTSKYSLLLQPSALSFERNLAQGTDPRLLSFVKDVREKQGSLC